MAHSKGGFFITKAKRDFLGWLAVTPATKLKLQLFASIYLDNTRHFLFFYFVRQMVARKTHFFPPSLVFTTALCIIYIDSSFEMINDLLHSLIVNICFEIYFRVYNSFKMSIPRKRTITYFTFSFYYFRWTLTIKNINYSYAFRDKIEEL